MKENKDEIQFWENDYVQYSIEEKKKFWLNFILRSLRWQGESVSDEFSFFNQEIYQRWKDIDSNIDIILDYVIEFIDGMYEGNGEITKDIKSRLHGKE